MQGLSEITNYVKLINRFNKINHVFPQMSKSLLFLLLRSKTLIKLGAQESFFAIIKTTCFKSKVNILQCRGHEHSLSHINLASIPTSATYKPPLLITLNLRLDYGVVEAKLWYYSVNSLAKGLKIENWLDSLMESR